jgi:hypothetical protein
MPDDIYCYTPFEIGIADHHNWLECSGILGIGKSTNKYSKFAIERVIFNNPATIVLWADGTKTVVKSGKNDEYDPEKGLALCIAKKALGNKGKYYDAFKEWLPEEKTEEKSGKKTTPLMVEAIIGHIITNFDDIKQASAVITRDEAVITCFDSNGKVICKAPLDTILDKLHDAGIK